MNRYWHFGIGFLFGAMIGAVTIGYFQTAKIERVSNNFILRMECWSRIIDEP